MRSVDPVISSRPSELNMAKVTVPFEAGGAAPADPIEHPRPARDDLPRR